MTQQSAATGLPKATEYHRTPMRILNSILSGLNKIGLARIDLSEQALIQSARKQTGLHLFGDEDFRIPMRVLLKSLEEEAKLNPIGRLLTKQSLVRILKHRLYLAELLDRHPEILERKITAPIVIVGLARSGTTRLHRLLASDQRFLHIKAWETVNPVPYPDSFKSRDGVTNKPDPRITGIEQGLKAVLYMSPQIAAVHPLGAHEIEEEVGLLQHAFSSQIFEVQAHIPSFAEWLMTHDQTYAYQHMVTLLKVISWYRNDPEDKPWVLKTPQHMQDLDALINVFPDAKIICSHRDPVKTVGSACSMTWTSIVRDSNHADPHWVGNEWLNKTDRMLKKTLDIRENNIPKAQQFDILYADIHQDWQQAIAKIYNFLNLEFNPEAKQGMQNWLDNNGQHKHGSHKYDLRDFGLNEAEVDKRLLYYREKFSIPYETKNAHTK